MATTGQVRGGLLLLPGLGAALAAAAAAATAAAVAAAVWPSLLIAPWLQGPPGAEDCCLPPLLLALTCWLCCRLLLLCVLCSLLLLRCSL